MASGPPQGEALWLRFVDGRPVRAVTIDYLEWTVNRLEQARERAFLLVVDVDILPLDSL